MNEVLRELHCNPGGFSANFLWYKDVCMQKVYQFLSPCSSLSSTPPLRSFLFSPLLSFLYSPLLFPPLLSPSLPFPIPFLPSLPSSPGYHPLPPPLPSSPFLLCPLTTGQNYGQPLNRVLGGNYEYRVFLRCRHAAKLRFIKLRSDVLVKLQLLDNKRGKWNFSTVLSWVMFA